jgi:hypothetical protein
MADGDIDLRPWLEQIFNINGDNINALDVSLHFPRLYAICWFNDYKIEGEAQTNWVNWTVTSNATAASEYLGRLRAAKQNRRYFLNASDMKKVTYGWNYTFDDWTTGSAPFAVSLSTNQRGPGLLARRLHQQRVALRRRRGGPLRGPRRSAQYVVQRKRHSPSRSLRTGLGHDTFVPAERGKFVGRTDICFLSSGWRVAQPRVSHTSGASTPRHRG